MAKKARAQRKSKQKRTEEEPLVGYQAVADRYDVSTRTVQDWIKKGLPAHGPARRRHFYASQTDPWVADFRRASDNDGEPSPRAELLQEQTRRERARAEREERQNQVDAGELVPRREYELFATEMIQEARDALLRIPHQYKRHLCKKCQGKIGELEELIETALSNLAKLPEGPESE